MGPINACLDENLCRHAVTEIVSKQSVRVLLRQQVLKEDIDVIRLTFYTAPVSVAILVPFFFARELQPLLTYW